MKKHFLLSFILLVIVLHPVTGRTEDNPQLSNQPCKTKPEYRQFDFWIGEWNVLHKDQKIAESHIREIVDSCVILENYTQADGYNGKSVNFYDQHLRKWRQTWIDARGSVSEFRGELKDGEMRYEGESHYPDGTKALRRMTFLNQGPDRIRQYSEISKDDGKTWSPYYDLIYIRKSKAEP